FVYLPPIFSCSRGELRLPTATQPLTLACRSGLRIKVLSNVVFEDLLQPLNDWHFPAPDLSAGYFAHGQEISIRGRNKNLVRRVQILWQQRFFFDRHTRRRSNLQQHPASDPLQAPRIQRGRRNPPVLNAKNVRGRALGYFAALVEQGNFIEPIALS